jgi:hypothetical protein
MSPDGLRSFVAQISRCGHQNETRVPYGRQRFVLYADAQVTAVIRQRPAIFESAAAQPGGLKSRGGMR